MKHPSKPFRTMLWAAFAAAQVACVPALPNAPISTPGAAPTVTRTPTRPPSPGASPTPTPQMPTATPIPSAASASSPSPTPTPRVPITFRSLQMVDSKIGWALADVRSRGATRILRSADGGATWRNVSPLDTDFYGAYFLDAQTAWAWSRDRGPAWRTLDGGQSWAAVGTFGWGYDLGFVDSQHGWHLIGEAWGLSFRQFDIISFSATQDGGLTWQETNPPPGWGSAYMAYPSAETAWALRAGFAQTGYGVPNLGVPFRIETTFDGGSTWTTRQMPLPPDAVRTQRPHEGTYLGDVGNCEFVSPVYNSTAIWKLALTCEARSWMYTTANQGKTWIISDIPAGLEPPIDFIDPSTGWLLIGDPYESPEGRLYRTVNGGGAWTLVKRTGWTDALLSFVDAQTGWAVVCSDAYCYQSDAQQALVKTTDGGQTWQAIELELTS